VDEVLAVGDESFQRKCGEKIDEIREAGKTIILVSHAMGTVQELCERCILIQNGKIVEAGATEKVIEEYHCLSEKGL